MNRKEFLSEKSVRYCCEDHFDVDNDTQNFMRHRIAGGRLLLKKDVIPHKFACQKTKVVTQERSAVAKRRRAEYYEKVLSKEVPASVAQKPIEFIECVQSDEVIKDPDSPIFVPMDCFDVDVEASVKIKTKKKGTQVHIMGKKKIKDVKQNSGRKILNLQAMKYSKATTLIDFETRGLMPPVFTPLNDDLTINYAAIPGYAKYMAEAGFKCVLVGGTTGEHMSLNVADRKKVIEEWVKAGRSTGLHIQVQVGGAPLPDVQELAAFCQKNGVGSILTLPELYFKPSNVDELVSYVALVAGAAPKLPVLYYHIPSMTRVEINMPAFVTEASKKIPNFAGIKFTSNDLSEASQVLRAMSEKKALFLGADTLLAPAALLGIKSSIGTSFNLFPKIAHAILSAVQNKDVETARALQHKLCLAIESLTKEGPWVPVMKAGMEIVTGIRVGPPSLPQKPLSSEAIERIRGRLRVLDVA
uniref:N-acetylneuraminate lyase n=2 Tax=Bombyx mori TaxID=7091 RepID=A0A8R2AK68_BOMMO|nr:N-acetylneuraminate lyase isoform X1 [Bombyx mori]